MEIALRTAFEDGKEGRSSKYPTRMFYFATDATLYAWISNGSGGMLMSCWNELKRIYVAIIRLSTEGARGPTTGIILV
jgi:hypothetical protein